MVCDCSTETTRAHFPTALRCFCNDMATALEERLSKSISDFALKLYKSVSEQQGNILFSPLCIHTVLSMLLPGAKERTLQQMKKALSVESTEDALSDFHDLFRHLNSAGVSDTVKTGNRIYIEKGLNVVDDYKLVTRDVFQSEYGEVSFSTQPSVAMDVINSWVSEVTNGKIVPMIDAIRPFTRLILVSAVYFNGFWEEQFPKQSTRMLPFHINSRQSVDIEMMHHEMLARIADFSELKAKAIDLPYKNNAFSMIIILPYDMDGLRSVEKSFDMLMLKEIMGTLGWKWKQVDISLPKFKLEETLNLEPFLSAMGMVDAFNCGEADLTGIVRNDRELHVAEVIQKAYIDVNEEGTEAAAASSVCAVDGAIVPKTFCADHPFIFLIVENRLKLVLFIGALKNPRSEETV